MKAAFAALFILLMTTSAFAAEPPKYAMHTLELPDKLVNVVSEDLDGDGLKDIVAVSVRVGKKTTPLRTISIFYQRRGGDFSREPDQSFALSPSAAVFDVGTVNGSGKKAIGFIAPDGLYAYLPNGRQYGTKPALLIKAGCVFSQPDGLDLPRWPFFVESAGKGPDMVLLPDIGRLLVYSEGGGSYRLINTLSFATQTNFTGGGENGPDRVLTISHSIPVVEQIVFLSPSGRDLFVTWGDNADVWPKAQGAGYLERPSVRFRPGLLDTAKREEGSLDNASVQAVDLDGDGRRDLVVTKMTGGVAQTKSLSFIYFCRKDGTFPDKPDESIITEGIVGPRILDVNGDGRQDILLPSIKLGISNFVNMLTSKRVNMDIGIYIQDRNGRYPEQPTKVKAVSFRLDISSLGKNARPVMAIGKFTSTPGYGLAVVSKDTQVSIYLPDVYSFFSDNPSLNLKVDAPTEISLTDMNGDGIDDIIMTYRKTKDNGSRHINVFLSK